MPARHFIFTSIIILSSSVFAQEPTAPEVTSEPIAISEVKEVAPQATVPAIQAEPIAPPAPVAPTPAPAPAPTVDPKVEAMQKQIEEMQKQLQTLSTQKNAPQTAQPVSPIPTKPSTPTSNEKGSHEVPLLVPGTDFSNLRKREFSLGWLYNSTNSETDVSQGGASDSGESRKVEIQIEFARNFTRYEIGTFLTNSYREVEDENLTTTVFGALVRFNFIENMPGNNFVPYFAGYLVLAGQEYNSAVSDEYEISGNGLGAALGFNWFPLGEIFALNAELRRLSGDLDNNASPKLKVEEEQTTVNVGWRIYF
ncbi:hypothetical protein Bb109J_c2998 [Bdellovibrio bacteriovorus]|nr:hypothetical protein EP01_01405 [Bdellovibrio bacteriovorus]BEV69578.1 hypothetical protein Bb109J_c2998 [Bdellovibrio bacteriovorus]